MRFLYFLIDSFKTSFIFTTHLEMKGHEIITITKINPVSNFVCGKTLRVFKRYSGHTTTNSFHYIVCSLLGPT